MEFEVLVVTPFDRNRPLLRVSYCSLQDALDLKKAYENLGLVACINPMANRGAA